MRRKYAGITGIALLAVVLFPGVSHASIWDWIWSAVLLHTLLCWLAGYLSADSFIRRHLLLHSRGLSEKLASSRAVAGQDRAARSMDSLRRDPRPREPICPRPRHSVCA